MIMLQAEVLLIAGDPTDRELIGELLHLRGRGLMRVSHAGTLRGALELLEHRTFDLVLFDATLPDASPLQALRVIGVRAPRTPVLPHSAFLTARIRQAARDQGSFDVVVRGELNHLWSAANKLLSLRALSGNSVARRW
jgi:CheY-like chemotaxis protein